MDIVLSNTSDKPLYAQIKEQIIDAILQGTAAEGDLMPSIRRFAGDLHVSVLTIRRVYDELEAEGFLCSQVGVGTFITTGNAELLRDAKRRQVEEKLAEAIDLAKSLGIQRAEINEVLDILFEEE